jgi:hypothetical protein
MALYAAQQPAAPVETEEKLVSELADVAEAHFLPTVKAMREALLAAREAIWSGGDTIRAITAIDAALACPSNARTAPESCQNCINEDDCASVDICRAVEEVTTPQPSSAVTEGAEEAIRDWWYSDRRQPMTSKEAAKSLIWYLAKCGFKIVREPQAGEWINEPLRNWTASTNEPQEAWQPIETAPRDGTPIEACNTRHPDSPPVIVRWDADGMSEELPEPHWCDAATKAGEALYYNQNYFDFWKPTTPLPRPHGGGEA